MRWAVHPLADGARAVRVGRLPEDVLADRPVATPGGIEALDTAPERSAVDGLVLEEAELAHLAGVVVRSRGQATRDTERAKPAGPALCVDPRNDVELERA